MRDLRLEPKASNEEYFSSGEPKNRDFAIFGLECGKEYFYIFLVNDHLPFLFEIDCTRDMVKFSYK